MLWTRTFFHFLHFTVVWRVFSADDDRFELKNLLERRLQLLDPTVQNLIRLILASINYLGFYEVVDRWIQRLIERILRVMLLLLAAKPVNHCFVGDDENGCADS